MASKLSDADSAKLAEVKAAMEAGSLGRNPADCFTKTGRPKAFSKAEALRLWRVLQEQQREEKLAALVENTPENYRLITNKRDFSQFLKALESEPIIAVDTETTGIDVYSDVIVGVSITLPSRDLHVYIPCGHEEGEQLDRDWVLMGLADILQSESIGKVLHNAVFDIQMFLRHDINMREALQAASRSVVFRNG